MSTGEDSAKVPIPALEDGPPTIKKRKIAVRACDFCRRKRVKCDAPSEVEGGKCTTCVAHNRDCTFVENAKKRGTPKGYVDYLEHRIDRLEEVLRRLLPSFDIEKHIGRRTSQAFWIEDREAHIPLERTAASSPVVRALPTQTHGIAQANVVVSALSPLEHAGDGAAHCGRPEDVITERLSQLQLGDEPFFGQSSGVNLMLHARHVKSWSTGQQDVPKTKDPHHRSWNQNSPGGLTPTIGLSIDRLEFPPQELLDNLVALYFRSFHPFFPTLHQPTFEAQLREKLHKSDVSFARQVLLVCAVGSRWSNDTRVCEASGSPSPSDNSTDWRVAGWRYFGQITDFPLPFNPTIRLLDLQNTLLYGFCELTTRVPVSPWLWAGMGVRCAMHMGAHLQKTYGPGHSLLNEAWKRTFWCLLNLDRLTSVGLGRPTSINEEDVDVGLPLEVDDALLADPPAGTQAGDKPSQMQFFTHWTELLRISVNAVKNIYGAGSSRAHPHSADEERQRSVVSELDRTLNDWLDKIPIYLRWNPNISSPVLFEQSANLAMQYHNVRIIMYRPFLPGTDKQISSLSYSSLAICTNAARSISYILEAYLKRILASERSSDASQMIRVTPINTGAVFIAGIVLLIAIWRLKATGENGDATPLIKDIQRIIEYLSYAKERIYLARGVLDTMNELASAGGLLANPTESVGSAKPSLKRSRNDGKVYMPERDPDSDRPACSSVADSPFKAIGLKWAPPPSQNMAFIASAEASSTPSTSLSDPVATNSHLASNAMDTDFGDLLNSALHGSQLFQTVSQASRFDPHNSTTINSFSSGFPDSSAYSPWSHPVPGNTPISHTTVKQPMGNVDRPGECPLPTEAQWDEAFYSVTTTSASVRNPSEVIQATNLVENVSGQMLTGTPTRAAFVPSDGLGSEHPNTLPPMLGNAANSDWTTWVADSWEMFGGDSLPSDFSTQVHPAL